MVRLRIGEIGDAQVWFGNENRVGSEIRISVAGHDTRMVTRELERFELQPVADRASQAFLELEEVSTALVGGGIIVSRGTELANAPGGEVALWTTSCPAAYMMTSPLAAQCCFGDAVNGMIGNYDASLHVNPAGAVVQRKKNPQGTACKASDGVSSCSGTACFYGPNGFGRPFLTTPDASFPYAKIVVESFTARDHITRTSCGYEVYASPQTPVFSDVTGTFSTGQGCPGGASGQGDWDY